MVSLSKEARPKVQGARPAREFSTWTGGGTLSWSGDQVVWISLRHTGSWRWVSDQTTTTLVPFPISLSIVSVASIVSARSRIMPIPR